MISFPVPPLGWIPDLPDPRDWTPADEATRELLGGLKRRGRGKAAARAQVDLREYLLPVGEGTPLRWSSARACADLLQYFERKATGRLLEPSSRFLYKMARRLEHRVGDAGASLRATLKALVRFGVPPREFWPDDPAAFDTEPDAAMYCFARDFATLSYIRLDAANGDGEQTLASVKSFLAAGFATALGVSLPSSVTADADIAYPTHFDAPRGGQALVAVGYDDARRIRSTRGALLVRNNWGPAWGEAGYGWLPYRYVEDRLALNFWTLARPDWLASGEFDAPA